jgi:uncharacterized protein RhaS with RHS repeats
VIDRYYDPTTGQFMSVDPLVNETQQPYAYTGGDPVNETDPSGRVYSPGNADGGFGDETGWPPGTGSGSEEPVAENAQGQATEAWSPDGPDGNGYFYDPSESTIVWRRPERHLSTRGERRDLEPRRPLG